MRARTLLLALFVAPFFNGCVCEEDSRTHERHDRDAREHSGEKDSDARPTARRRIATDASAPRVRVRVEDPIRVRSVSVGDPRYRWFPTEVMRIKSGDGETATARRRVRDSDREADALRKRMANSRRQMERDAPAKKKDN